MQHELQSKAQTHGQNQKAEQKPQPFATNTLASLRPELRADYAADNQDQRF